MSQVLSSAGRASSLGIPSATPTVFVVDDDVSVRESLELLISFESWRPETFASAHEFLARRESQPRVAWCSTCRYPT